jgi:UDP-N-acetylmuramyl pentapeptide synthase
MVEFLLSPDFNIIRSPKSYNSQVGVPLSVIAINEKHNLGYFEAGISTVSEMFSWKSDSAKYRCSYQDWFFVMMKVLQI